MRQIAINKYNLEYRKKQERENMHRKIKAFEAERASGYFSGLWGGKTNEQKTKDDKGKSINESMKYNGVYYRSPRV